MANNKTTLTSLSCTIKDFFFCHIKTHSAANSTGSNAGHFASPYACHRLSLCCKRHRGIAPTRHLAASAETAVMDPIESRSITIQTGESAVKTLSISCRVFARFLVCNEVLINNSWLPLIFNGRLLHGTLLDEGRGFLEGGA